jgi:type IV pilus assembly protein PilM
VEKRTQMSKITYTDKPVFGLDIGRSSIKMMQVETVKGKSTVVGYGNTFFKPESVNKGVIVDFDDLANATHELFTKQFVGTLASKRVAFSIPNEHSFSRVLVLPKMNSADLADAIFNEASRTIPMKIEDLYLDYSVGSEIENNMQEVQLLATPREIIDSYMVLAETLGLEVAAIEANISSVSRIVTHAEGDDVITMIIDLGSTAADLSIYDGSTVRITGTADCGSEDVTRLIASRLGVSSTQAHTIKTRYGLEPSKKQVEILDAIKPELDKLLAEIRKMIRYYNERATGSSALGQIIVLGGGANLPGLSTYITDQIRIPTRLCDPWQNISFAGLHSPHQLETTIYTTAAGLSLISEEELIND